MADETSTPADEHRGQPRRRRKLRRVASLLTLIAALVVLGLFGGFIWFAGKASHVSDGSEVDTADGIVAFTGGRDRIAVATRLLSRGKGRRLLISGVNPATPRVDLESLTPEMERLSRCCVDLGREAEDTIGNAAETADWARRHGFRSLIVVTNAYHLPRSLTELAGAMPEASLHGVPVATPRLAEPWWRNAQAARLLVAEYTKYLASSARNAIARRSPAPPSAD